MSVSIYYLIDIDIYMFFPHVTHLLLPDEDFETGHCRGTPNSTFGNPPLSSQTDFKLASAMRNPAYVHFRKL